jgi:hypothetical protein
MVSGLLDHIDQYCERLTPGLTAEPLNFWTNLSFVLAAAAGFLAYKQRSNKSREPGIEVLLGLAFTVGIGSALFHSFANRLTMIADVVPIGLFLIASIGVLTRRLLRWTFRRTALALVFFFGATAALGVGVPGKAVNGGQWYLGTVLLLGYFAVTLRSFDPVVSRQYLGAFLAFSAALVFRSVDEAVCPHFPAGTHFLWHTFNGIVIYLSLAAMVRIHNQRPG